MITYTWRKCTLSQKKLISQVSSRTDASKFINTHYKKKLFVFTSCGLRRTSQFWHFARPLHGQSAHRNSSTYTTQNNKVATDIRTCDPGERPVKALRPHDHSVRPKKLRFRNVIGGGGGTVAASHELNRTEVHSSITSPVLPKIQRNILPPSSEPKWETEVAWWYRQAVEPCWWLRSSPLPLCLPWSRRATKSYNFFT
jgi:hypothetical protein